MEPKTVQQMRVEFYGAEDSRSYDSDEKELMVQYASQAVRMALSEAANIAGSALHLKAGEHYYPTTVDKFILSLESSIVAKMK